MADLAELLVGELRLERLHEPRRGLAGRVGDHVQLDRGIHPGTLTGDSCGPDALRGTLCAVKHVLLACLVALVLPAAALAWDGTYPTGDAAGTSIHIVVSDAYPVDQTLPQSWAAYLGSLPHGPELSLLTLNLMPLSVVESNQYCGDQSLACYDPSNDTIYAAPDDQLDDAACEGDRDARVRPPHREQPHRHAVVGGGLRDEALVVLRAICARTAAGTASPGDEGAAYSQNPGEAFAESYRVLALTAIGQTPSSWEIVSQTFFPDATALNC